MDNFLMICYVSATFGPLDGLVFTVTPSMIGSFIEAPLWIKKTQMFKWLLNDGSIKVAESSSEAKKVEADPMAGISAEGKDAEITKKAETEIKKAMEEPVKVTTKTRKRVIKKDDAE